MPEITTEDFMFASEFFLVNSLPPDFESWADNQLDDFLTNNASEMLETHSPDFIWESIETLARGVVRYAGSRIANHCCYCQLADWACPKHSDYEEITNA